jgi:flagellar motor protein MotB
LYLVAMDRSAVSLREGSQDELQLAWNKSLEIVCRLIEAPETALRNGHLSEQLQFLPSTTQQLVAVASNTGNLGKEPSISQLYSEKLLELLSKLLSARKEPKDWQQEGYCSSVGAVLAACTRSMQLQHGMRAALTSLMKTDILEQLTAAQEEMAGQLKRQQAQLQDSKLLQQQRRQQQQQQQQDQQQQSEAPPPQRQMQAQVLQQQQQQAAAVRALAGQLLQWCLAAKWLWSAEHKCGSNGATFQLRAVELAAALAVVLPSDDKTNRIRVLLVVCRVLQKLDRLKPGDVSSVRQELHSSPAFLQLSVLVLLLLGCAGADFAISFAHYTSSSTGNSSSSSSSSSSRVLHTKLGKYKVTEDLATAAGFGPTPWSWLILSDDLVQRPLVLAAMFSSAGSSSSRGGGSSSSSFRKLPPSACQYLQGFAILAQVITNCLSAGAGQAAGPEYSLKQWSSAKPLQKYLQRLQELMPRVLCQLPLFLLQTASAAQLGMSGGGDVLVAAAAEAAWCCCSCWPLLLKPIKVSAGQEGTGSEAGAQQQQQQQLGQAVPPLLDCWLQLMHQQLRQGPGGGVLGIAPPQQQQRQQQWLNLEMHFTCECYPEEDINYYDASCSAPTVFLDCGYAYSITALLVLLQSVSCVSYGDVAVWEGKLPAVLLLLEGLLRRVGAFKVFCGSSGSSSDSDSSLRGTGAIRMFDGCMRVLKAVTKDWDGDGMLCKLLQQQ